MAIGNDATRIYILNDQHEVLDSLSLFDYPKKVDKPLGDAGIQATAIVTLAGTPALLIMGSGQQRTDKSDIWLFPLKGKSYSEVYTPALTIPDFFKQMKRKGIGYIDIEGAAEVNQHIVLANAASEKNKLNHFVVTEFDFWAKGATASLQVIALQNTGITPLRVTGLEFVIPEDLLLFSASSFDKQQSFIGLIEHATKRLKAPQIIPDYVLPLQSTIPELSGKKLQSICLGQSSQPGEIIIHVCALDDNDDCYIYKLLMKR